ncbi:uncharacterized protein LOC107804158 [Nicotiana tabacum]|uniref:Serine-rich adhesin for platelets-like n=4 Tax=Nicotiana TaxID=4085 RepID=A0A1S4B3R9_TOBAC|nr:PREDICTED: uncharacterized protein LOC104223112 isoform X2 [Nicotiana sylvestris]XP_016483483.1 PREDICTED: serine-rich adhesin for platelets-like [Nicotiana tabacum]XP_016483484.1 PREDICTED: serine-rich adhesin for platelets-like [Nicotiana tabacum]XP_016483485.1 PREDICTED: serine-rich adhesin for platelets-like [Nicotiana tabacum]XP_016483486.1 PREDICTED: serine-rich adhesin for platelets-like [Nicotiana tabacum]XP_016483487.1 PREDICTED: serine-rich adhesin for platelets-like [Nicotiana ta
MKENLDEKLNHSNGYNESKSLVFPTKDLLDSNGYHGGKDSLESETKERNEFWKHQELNGSVFFEDISRSNKHETTCKRNGNPFACDTEDRDHTWSIPEFEGSMIVDVDDKENGAIVSNAPFTSVSELFGIDTLLFTDKGVVECKLPESTICYKESNYNIMKDICIDEGCIDEGVPLVDKIVTESTKDDQPNSSVSLAADEHRPSYTRGDIDSELFSTGEYKASSIEDTDKIALAHHTTKEDEDTKSLVPIPSVLKPSSEDNISKGAVKDSCLEDVMKIFGSKYTTMAKAINTSEKEPGIQNSKESGSDADQSAQQPDQMPSGVATVNSQNAVSAPDEKNNNGPRSNFFSNSKSEAGAITCDQSSTESTLSSSVENVVNNLPEKSLKLESNSSHKDGSSDSISAGSQFHFTNSVDRSDRTVHGQSLDPKNMANLEDKTSDNLPLGTHGHFADGEASFSAGGPASGLITYSGPISHSGSVSLRSDSSTTSARSFAFPVLQNEWNSSPVRMAKTERRRKQRGWRQSLLCCRF